MTAWLRPLRKIVLCLSFSPLTRRRESKGLNQMLVRIKNWKFKELRPSKLVRYAKFACEVIGAGMLTYGFLYSYLFITQ